MKVEVSPRRKVVVLGVDKRQLEDLAWCASTYGGNRARALTAICSALKSMKNLLNMR